MTQTPSAQMSGSAASRAPMQSMTGYGTASMSVGNTTVTVEMRSVNQRFLEVNTKLPPAYNRFEQEVVRLVRDLLRRGKVDVYVARSEGASVASATTFQREPFVSMMSVLDEALATIDDPAERKELRKEVMPRLVTSLLQRRDIVDSGTAVLDVENEREALMGAVEGALFGLVSMRTTEGKALAADLTSNLNQLSALRKKLDGLSGVTVQNFQTRLNARLEQLQLPPELISERLSQEVALLADRTDISEELVRFQSHEQQFLSAMSNADGGKKLDFLIQELLREVNTVGSKGQNAEITATVVEAKCLIEKLKEQVQNVE